MSQINNKIFKTYDIRGVYPSELDEKTAFVIGQTCAKYFASGTFVVAYDARLSSKKLFKSFLNGFQKTTTQTKKKFKIEIVGLSTTPMYYFLVNYFKAVGGAMVTASHNPKEYGGFKIVGKKARMIGGKEIERIIEGVKI
ncbi:MAG: hypothetical protein QY304_01240 [Candidatus Paceibacterota bacterium]|nr:MAG: hypothetical protein QY304_01240 [Candidatus Paceibacterota bacterium]